MNNQRTTSEQPADTNNNNNNNNNSNTIIINNTPIAGKNPVIEARDYFYLKYKEKFNNDYIPDYAKDGKIFKDLLKIIPIADLKPLIDLFLNSLNDFTLKAGFTIGVFRTQVNKLRCYDPLAKYYKKE